MDRTLHQDWISITRACAALLFTLLGTCPPPPAPCPTLGAGELKIGYVNLAKVFDEYQHTKESGDVLERQGKTKQEELENRLNELQKLRQTLEVLNDKARDAREREVEEKADELTRFREGTARDLRRQRDRVAQEILQEIERGITDFANANGYTLILDQRSLLFGHDAQDVTDQVLKLLNDRYAKAADKSSAKR